MTDRRRSLMGLWDQHADEWIAWARTPGHDTYWMFHREAFFEHLPPPGHLTIDIGSGEGRVARDLKKRGHRVIGVDPSPVLSTAARRADPSIPVCLADGGRLPFADSSADLIIAFMSLQDMEDMRGAVAEVARVLRPRGNLHAAVVHPLNAAGGFDGEEPGAPFVIKQSYFERRRYADTVRRDGLQMTFASKHYTLEDYFSALRDAGLVVERVGEVTDLDHPQWRRLPMFLHFRAFLPPV